MSVFEITPDRITSDYDTMDDMVVWVQAPNAASMQRFADRTNSHYRKVANVVEDCDAIDIVIDELGEIVERRV